MTNNNNNNRKQTNNNQCIHLKIESINRKWYICEVTNVDGTTDNTIPIQLGDQIVKINNRQPKEYGTIRTMLKELQGCKDIKFQVLKDYIHPGDYMRLQGLKEKAEWNGSLVQVGTSVNDRPGRWWVRFVDYPDMECITVKSQCLRPVNDCSTTTPRMSPSSSTITSETIASSCLSSQNEYPSYPLSPISEARDNKKKKKRSIQKIASVMKRLSIASTSRSKQSDKRQKQRSMETSWDENDQQNHIQCGEFMELTNFINPNGGHNEWNGRVVQVIHRCPKHKDRWCVQLPNSPGKKASIFAENMIRLSSKKNKEERNKKTVNIYVNIDLKRNLKLSQRWLRTINEKKNHQKECIRYD